MTGLGFIVRLFGVKIVESPREVRLTVPRYLTRLFGPGLLDATVRRMAATGGKVERLNERSLLITLEDSRA